MEKAIGLLRFEDLIREQAELEVELAKVDMRIEYNKNKESAKTEHGEKDAVEKTIDEKNIKERNQLIFERAELASQRRQIRLILELVDRGGRMESKNPACRDYDEFFERTREEAPTLKDKVIRYVQRINILISLISSLYSF